MIKNLEEELIGKIGEDFAVLEQNPALKELVFSLANQINSSKIDKLTGLYSRKQFDIDLEEKYKQFYKYVYDDVLGNITHLSLIMLDLDHLKHINDNYGHQIGDQCIARVGEIIGESLRGECDSGYRYGGDEFAILLSYTGQDGIRRVGERILEKTRKTVIEAPSEKIKIGVSLGGISYPNPNIKSAEEFLKKADEALYMAKQQGRNRLCLIDEE